MWIREYTMKLRYLLLALILSNGLSLSYAQCYNHRLAVQGALATGGNLSIGLVDYTEISEIGLTVSGKYSSSPGSTRTVTPVLFAGLRNYLCQQTYFAYGLDLAGTFGRRNGCNIRSDYQVGPYISLEYMLTCHLMLAGWIQPYQYHYEKFCWSSTTTHSFFNTGGIAINYLF